MHAARPEKLRCLIRLTKIQARLRRKILFLEIRGKHNEGLDFVLSKMIEARRSGYTGAFDSPFVVDAMLSFAAQNPYLKSSVEQLRAQRPEMLKMLAELNEKGARRYASEADIFQSAGQKRHALTLIGRTGRSLFCATAKRGSVRERHTAF